MRAVMSLCGRIGLEIGIVKADVGADLNCVKDLKHLSVRHIGIC